MVVGAEKVAGASLQPCCPLECSEDDAAVPVADAPMNPSESAQCAADGFGSSLFPAASAHK